MKQDVKKDLFFLALLLIMVLIAFWQVAFLRYILKWDMIDAYFPWRYFSGECLSNKMMPLWLPYQQCGFPLHANLMSFWYIEETFIGSFFGYKIFTIHILFISYIYLAGIGMYFLSMYLIKDKLSAFLVAVGFMLSGFCIGNAQHLNYIIGCTWLPFVVLFYLKLSEKRSILNSIIAVLFINLLVTGGYPSITIITFYLIFSIFCYHIINAIVKQDWRFIKIYLFNNSIIVLLTLIFASGIIVSFLQVKPFVERFSHLDFSNWKINSFSPQCLISLFLPFGVTTGNSFFNNDISMSNIFFGTILFLFFVLGLFQKKRGIFIVIFCFGCFSFLAMMGGYISFFSKIIYNGFPLMDKFRHLSVFRLFVIFSFLLIAGKNISTFYLSKDFNYKNLKLIVIVVVCLLISLFIYFSFKTDISNFTFFKLGSRKWIDILGESNLFERFIFQIVIQILLLGVLLFSIERVKLRWKIIPLLIVTELVIATQLNMHSTVISKYNPLEVDSHIQIRPKGFPLPFSGSLIYNTDKAFAFGPMYRNTNIYHKNISYSTFNSFNFKNYTILDDSLLLLRDAVLKNNLTYLSDSISPMNELNLTKPLQTDILFLADSIYYQYKNYVFSVSPNDKIELISYSPNKIELHTETEDSTILTLLQSNFVGWTVSIDRIPQQLVTSNLLFISSILPPGEHKVVFEYRNEIIRILFFVTNSVFIVIIICILIISIHKVKWLKKRTKVYCSFIIPILIFGMLGTIYLIKPTQEELKDKAYSLWVNDIENWIQNIPEDSIQVILNIDNRHDIPKIISNKTLQNKTKHIRFKNHEDLGSLVEAVSNDRNPPYLLYVTYNQYHPKEIDAILDIEYGEVIEKQILKNGIAFLRKKKITENGFITFNNYDIEVENWNKKETLIYEDTTYNHIEMLDSINIYSSTFEASCTDMGVENKILFLVLVESKIISGDRAKLVIETHKNNDEISWHGFDLTKNTMGDDLWGKATIARILTLEDCKKVKIYVWNHERDTILIDNFEIRVFSLT